MDEVREILVECLSCLLGYRGVLDNFIETQSAVTTTKQKLGQTKIVADSLVYFSLVFLFQYRSIIDVSVAAPCFVLRLIFVWRDFWICNLPDQNEFPQVILRWFIFIFFGITF